MKMMRIYSDIMSGDESIEVASVKFTLSDIDVEFIKKAKAVLSENAFLNGVSLDMNIEIQQFANCVEDEDDIEEIERGDFAFYSHEMPEINVYKSGGIYLKVCNKHDGGSFFEVEIEL